MTEEKFSELVNLYLDKEISELELEILKAELASNGSRKEEFQERCRLHQAMRLAMGAPVTRSEGNKRRRSSSRSSSRSKSASSSSRSGERRRHSKSSRNSERFTDARREAPQAFEFQVTGEAAKVVPLARKSGLSRKLVLSGLTAACFAVGIYKFTSLSSYTQHLAQETFHGGDVDQFATDDSLEAINRSDLKRFAQIQSSSGRRSSSLAAELRLLGLRPDLMAEEVSLSDVNYASIQPRDVRQRRIEMLNQLEQYSPIPAPSILQVAEPQSSSAPAWPAGFKTSLASFK